jgi:hypothetical protein
MMRIRYFESISSRQSLRSHTQMPKMPTPRMLARTLFTLRHTRAELGLDVLGKNIDISDSHLNRLERRSASESRTATVR